MKGKVLFDFAPQSANQIILKAGQIVDITAYGGAGGWSSAVELGTGTAYIVMETSLDCYVLNVNVLYDD